VEGIEQRFVGLPSPVAGRAGAGGHPCQGLWHAPEGRSPRVGVIATHFNIDFSEHYLAEPLARRGLGVLGWNTRFRGNEATFALDHALAEIGVGVRWLREEAGVDAVVLLGNSGGGSLMAAYQSQAVEPQLAPSGRRPVPTIDELPPADLYVSLAAHPGRPDVFTNWLDPSVVDEGDPASTDPSLDLYDPANGPPFDPAFLARYRQAQVDRNRRITRWAQAELVRLGAAGHHDRLFAVPRLWADPRFVDPGLDPNERPTPGCYLGDPARANRGIHGVGVVSSLRSWLQMWSLDHSPCRAGPHLARVSVPSLVVQASADSGVFPSDAAAIHDALAATDKHLVTMPGDHYFLTPVGARDHVAELVAAWVAERT
jgi:hypothetical protein